MSDDQVEAFNERLRRRDERAARGPAQFSERQPDQEPVAGRRKGGFRKAILRVGVYLSVTGLFGAAALSLVPGLDFGEIEASLKAPFEELNMAAEGATALNDMYAGAIATIRRSAEQEKQVRAGLGHVSQDKVAPDEATRTGVTRSRMGIGTGQDLVLAADGQAFPVEEVVSAQLPLPLADVTRAVDHNTRCELAVPDAGTRVVGVRLNGAGGVEAA
ncbi:MAG: hypothetical protein AAF367_02075 [Pseudomonadota bacterium]